MFKDGHYIDCGLSLEEIEKLEDRAHEENKKYKSWDEVSDVTEDQNDCPD